MKRKKGLAILLLLALLTDLYLYFPVRLMLQHFSDFGIKIWYSQYILLTIVAVYAIVQFYFIKPLKARFQNVMVSIIATYFSIKMFFLLGSLLIDWVLFDFSLTQNSLKELNPLAVVNGGQLMWLNLGVSLLPAIFLFGGIINGGIRIKKEYVEVFIRDLPEELDGYKIVQLSDIHLGSFFRRSRIAHAVEDILDEDPDIVCVTGDLVNFRSNEIEGFENV